MSTPAARRHSLVQSLPVSSVLSVYSCVVVSFEDLTLSWNLGQIVWEGGNFYGEMSAGICFFLWNVQMVFQMGELFGGEGNFSRQKFRGLIFHRGNVRWRMSVGNCPG